MGALRVVHTSVVRFDAQAGHLQFSGDLLDAFTSRSVDDSRTACALDQSLECIKLFFLGIDVRGLGCQVWPAESGDQVPRAFESELLTDVGSDALSCSCRQ